MAKIFIERGRAFPGPFAPSMMAAEPDFYVTTTQEDIDYKQVSSERLAKKKMVFFSVMKDIPLIQIESRNSRSHAHQI